jgi:hypothetical protein
LTDIEYPNGARIKLNNTTDSVTQWNDIATWGIETFGLPGDRYITDTNINNMTWWFKEPRDQTLFVLKYGFAECTKL